VSRNALTLARSHRLNEEFDSNHFATCLFCAKTPINRNVNNQRRMYIGIAPDLPHEILIELAVGIKVMVTNNLETDLDIMITNGARGKFVDIILHPKDLY